MFSQPKSFNQCYLWKRNQIHRSQRKGFVFSFLLKSRRLSPLCITEILFSSFFPLSTWCAGSLCLSRILQGHLVSVLRTITTRILPFFSSILLTAVILLICKPRSKIQVNFYRNWFFGLRFLLFIPFRSQNCKSYRKVRTVFLNN